ncbi:hypothetical protein [uncultured Arthrobacter sp.]|uniref:hypothetical protein n=1 Tax=uncultured Arthrobacter sp. TaxID=114050 RepID=UPI0025D308AC|nr:hypothetical protein [uncultured Arthrobacter sp.]
MHHDFARTSPEVAPNDIEWAFQDGTPSIVAHIPDGEGNYSVVRLDQTAPESIYEREQVRALLRIARHQMDVSEPTLLSAMTAEASR